MSYATYQRDQRFLSRQPPPAEPVRGCYSPVAFWIVLITAIILAVVVILILVLYFRKNASLIDPAECPVNNSGIVVKPDTTVATVASNCGSVSDCTYFGITSVSEAVGICSSLGNTKCKQFSLNGTTMQVASTLNTVADVGSNTYQMPA